MNAAWPSSSQSHARPRSDRDLEVLRDIADDVIESEFVPYACLLDAATLATKNGELLQIIKITGLGFDTARRHDLRSALRTAIQQCIPDESYAIWLHTLRRQKQLLQPARFPDDFSRRVDQSWSETHPASASYVNELYVTIVKASTSASRKPAAQRFVDTLLAPRHLSERGSDIDRAMQALAHTAGRMVTALAPFGARLLTVLERDGITVCEQLEFLEKLINLEERSMPVPMRDLSDVLTSGDITFAHNSMEVRTAEGKRRFACIFTIKEYKESTLLGIDKFLDIPCEFIVSQCFDFIGAEHAQQSYERQARYLTMSNDKELAQWMEIDRLTTGSAQRAYGEQQTTLFFIAPSIRQLEANVKLAQKSLSKLGIVAIREDLRFEDCYWAQLPGNFSFISRKQSVDTQHLAGFATVQTQPIGNASGSVWGPPISVLTTVQDAPYFFNFHRDAGAHTLVLGRPGTGCTSVAHFLMAQARKLPLRMWYLDSSGRASTAMREMGGRVATPGTPDCRLNPLALPDTAANREFLTVWLSTLLDPKGRQLTRSSIEFFQNLVATVMQLPPPQRRIGALRPIVREIDAALSAALQPWCEGGEYGHLFDHAEDHLQIGPLCSWNLKPTLNDKTRAALASYFLHRLTMALDGQPTLMILNEGLELLDNALFGARSLGWMDYLTQQNAAAMLTCSALEEASHLPFTAAVAQRAASIFAMPDAHAGAEYAMGFGFRESELATLHYMQPGARHVLLKRGDDATLLKMDLSNLGVLLPSLIGKAPLMPVQKSAAEMLSELMGYGAPA